MKDIRTMIKDMESMDDSDYSFKRIPADPGFNSFQVIENATGDQIDTWTFDSNENVSSVVGEVSAEIMSDYRKFKTRPEWWLGVRLHYDNLQDVIRYHDVLIVACMLNRFKDKGDDVGIRHGMRILDWLATTDFYTAPASGRFHDAYEGGLISHTINVYNQMCEVWKVQKFNDVLPQSFTLVALTHDWCKIGLYESYMRNVKDEKTGQWNQVKSFRWREDGPVFAFGHGVSSMFLVSRFVNLSGEEAAAIRWHMGSYRCVNDEFSELQTCNERYPLVHMIQFADALSIVRY